MTLRVETEVHILSYLQSARIKHFCMIYSRQRPLNDVTVWTIHAFQVLNPHQ